MITVYERDRRDLRNPVGTDYHGKERAAGDMTTPKVIWVMDWGTGESPRLFTHLRCVEDRRVCAGIASAGRLKRCDRAGLASVRRAADKKKQKPELQLRRHRSTLNSERGCLTDRA